jgi:hypothetical protein
MNEIIKNQIWTINNFLTDDECDKFIELINTTKCERPFTRQGKFKNNKFINQGLANKFFAKVKKYINIPMLRANNLVMTGKYVKGNAFSLHTDTGLYLDIDKMEKSNYTLLIYLNDNFEGGNTVFFDNNFKEMIQIKPERGKALLFDISLWHKGQELLEGEKYWIGCEIISRFNLNDMLK